jgi:hypothetical protein
MAVNVNLKTLNKQCIFQYSIKSTDAKNCPESALFITQKPGTYILPPLFPSNRQSGTGACKSAYSGALRDGELIDGMRLERKLNEKQPFPAGVQIKLIRRISF